MAFTRIQGTGAASTTAGGPLSATLTGVTAGRLLVVVADSNASGSAPPVSISDNQGNTWSTAVSNSAFYGSSGSTVAVFWLASAPGGSTTITITSHANNRISLSLDEYSYSGGVAVDATATHGATFGTTAATNSMALTGTDLVVAGFDLLQPGMTYTAGSGFTLGYTTNSAGNQPFCSEYNAAQSTTPVSPGISFTAISFWSGVAAAFIETAPATPAYGVDAGGGGEGVLARGRAGESAASIDAARAARAAGDAAASPADGLGVLVARLGGEEGVGGEIDLVTVLAQIDLAGSDEGTGFDAAALAVPVDADAGTGDAGEWVARVVAGLDSGTIGELEYLRVSGAFGVIAADPAFGSESAPAPTDWGTDDAAGPDESRGILRGGEAGGEAEAGGGAGATLTTTVLLAVDAGRVGEAAWWSQLVLGCDAGAAAECSAIDLVSAGYHIYANTGAGDPINYASPVGTVLGFANTTWTSGPLAAPGTWKFGVRAYDACGEETNVDSVVHIILDGAGVDITDRPAAPAGLRAFATAGGGIRVEWTYPPTRGPRAPTGFHVYAATGAPIDYASPAATVAYSSGFMNAFRANISGLSDGSTYQVGVRAFNATSFDANVVTVTVVADSTGPLPVDDLSATAVV